MADVITVSAKALLAEAARDMRAAVDGASAEALNRRPGGDDTNAMAVLAVHAMHSTRWWLSVSTGAPLPARVRDEEFVASAPDATWLLSFVEQMGADCVRLLEDMETPDWAAVVRPDADGQELTRGWALLHAMTHLREHTGQIMLTRQLVAGGSP